MIQTADVGAPSARAPLGNNLDALLRPNSVAIVGASGDTTKLSGLPLYFLRRHGYSGRIFPINPRGGEFDGLHIYRNLDEVPEPIDLAMLLLPAELVKALVEKCVEIGVKAAIVTASGFAEVGGDGPRRQQELVEIARSGGMRLLGPNCMGVVNVLTGAAVSFSQALLVERLRPGRLAFLSQSGAIGGSVLDLCHSRGIGLSHWLSSGNQADVNVVEVGRYLLQDDAVQVLALYLESLGDPAEYVALLEEGAALGKPIIVLKSGASATGARAASSHTGALAGNDAVVRSITRQYGALLVTDVEELVDTAAAVLTGRTAAGRSVGVVSSSGGVGVLLADYAEAVRLTLPALGPEATGHLSSVVPAYGSVQNPVDVSASLVARMMGGELGLWQSCFESVVDDPSVDQLVVGLTMVTGRAGVTLADEVVAAANHTQKPVLVSWLGADLCQAAFARLHEAGIPVYPSVARAMRVAAKVADLGQSRAAPARTSSTRPVGEQLRLAAAALPVTAGVLTEVECLPLLRAAGIAVPESVLATTPLQARSIAERIGGPVVMKVQSSQLLHKTAAGAIRVGVHASSVEKTFRELIDHVQNSVPSAKIDGILIQELVAEGQFEVLVGVTRDFQFGLILALGLGGVWTEVFGEVALRRLPLTNEQIAALCREGKLGTLLDHASGQLSVDRSALERAIGGIVEIVQALGERLVELEINPLLVRRGELGIYAVDCLIRLAEEPLNPNASRLP